MCEIAENCFQVAIIFSAKHPPDSPVWSLDESFWDEHQS